MATTDTHHYSHDPSIHRYYYKEMTAVVLALVGLVVLGLTLSGEAATRYVQEGGPIETLSAAGYLVCIITLFRESSIDFVKRHFYFVVVPLAMCLREMDFHNQYTAMSITKSSFYVSGAVPLVEKLAAVLVIGFLVFCAIVMVRRHGRAFWNGLKRFDATALAVAAAGLSAVAAKTLDGLPRKLGDIGISLGDNVEIASLIIEEVLELGIPAFMAVAIFAYFARRNDLFATAGRR